jgi:hypothetical protein
MDGEGRAHPRIGGRELLDHERVARIPRTGPAVLRRHDEPHETNLRERLEKLKRKVLVAIPGARVGSDLLAYNIACKFGGGDLLGGER